MADGLCGVGKSTASRSLASRTHFLVVFSDGYRYFSCLQGFMRYIFFTEVKKQTNKQTNKNTSTQSSSSEHVPWIRQVLQCTIRGCSGPWWKKLFTIAVEHRLPIFYHHVSALGWREGLGWSLNPRSFASIILLFRSAFSCPSQWPWAITIPRRLVLSISGNSRHAIDELCFEKNISVVEHSVFEGNHDELRMLEVCSEHLTDVLCVGEIQGGIYFIEDVQRSGFKEEHGENERERYQRPERDRLLIESLQHLEYQATCKYWANNVGTYSASWEGYNT